MTASAVLCPLPSPALTETAVLGLPRRRYPWMHLALGLTATDASSALPVPLASSALTLVPPPAVETVASYACPVPVAISASTVTEASKETASSATVVAGVAQPIVTVG